MQENKDFSFSTSSSSENFISLNQTSSIESFYETAYQLSISILFFENITMNERDTKILDYKSSSFDVLKPNSLIEKFKDEHFSNERLKVGFYQYISTIERKPIVVATRKTLSILSKDDLMRNLVNSRRKHEIISIRSKDKDLLKWAAKDRRIDYVIIDLQDKPDTIDKALCSLIKQNNKCFEIILSPLLVPSDNKSFSSMIRTGKKVMKLILSLNVPFIFTMNPQIPLHMRTGKQMRYIGELIGTPFNKSRNAVFDYQLSTLIDNTIKLHENYVFEGVKEVSE
jgi:RNase P/RNase MRP subunit p30